MTLKKLSYFKKPSILPGFYITLSFTLFYLFLIVLIPLSGLFFKTFTMSLEDFIEATTSTRVLYAYYVSFLTALLAAILNLFFGLAVAWMLVRYKFPFRKIFDAMIDLPFALPTAVAGIALTTLYAPQGWLGQYLTPYNIQIAFTPIGIVIALIFIGLPFVVRTVQPVLEDMPKELEEAAASLGASRWQCFNQVIIPHLMPSLLTGFAMAFARGLGEYGSVIFIAGNIPMQSEIVPLIIAMKLEQFDYAGATAIATVMLIVSFIMLLSINYLQKLSRSHMKKGA
jgi:sulfate transport system permease protein